MPLRDLKKGDKIFAVYNFYGDLSCDLIYECTVRKVITKDFVTTIYLDDGGRGVGKRAVGYYLGNCALNADYFFVTTKSRLEAVNKIYIGYRKFLEIENARDIILELIKRV